MSTRCTTHFNYGKQTEAIIYRHSDGYPGGAGLDLKEFLRQCKELPDSRFGDPSYLAAKYVVFLANMFNHHYRFTPDNEMKVVKPPSRLEFLSVGVCMRDPGDIEYRYVIDCEAIGKDGFPELKCYERTGDWDNPEWGLVAIPEESPA